MLFFASLSFSVTSSDLSPPYKQDNEGKINYWELRGGALLEDSSILLSPPIQYTRGGVWSVVEIPKDDFSITYDFKISEGTQGGGLGFWFISDYAAYGELFGGPDTFNGCALLAGIKKLESSDRLELRLSYAENDGTKKVSAGDLAAADYVLQFDNRNHIILKIEFFQNELVISGTSDGKIENIVEFFRVQRRIDITENYFGVTSQSDIYTSRFDLYSVLFDLYEKSDSHKRKASASEPNQQMHYTPSEMGRYRSPIFRITNEEAARKENGIQKDGSKDIIFDMIEELTAASQEVASFKDVNSIIRNKVSVYASKWQKRTVSMLERVQKSRNVTGATLEFTNQIMKSFSETLRHSSLKTMNRIIDLQQQLADEAEGGVDHYGELDAIKESATASITKNLTYISIIEIVIVAIAFVLLQLPSFRKKLTN
ncbi:Legume-like lectin family protein [Trichomonas vaginalis G3]|uniref:Legume-like lectin family protein n=2 Tax=Trichomonas vaginalis TaxID=5722 RepID=A2DR24_TRIV3|nr:carbohydrate binding [Trichomonas vaginalis G3]EAY17123.1 Legume-like lectin family protein [Trichomonas vaginalis G3]KAI5508833.1 carbohydrate binding [Trichomonas vaginalis G3]|eukprot:XP_001329346.1 Legume-like lectin family protein [Trichomonas vaginalis G3]